MLSIPKPTPRRQNGNDIVRAWVCVPAVIDPEMRCQTQYLAWLL